MGRNSTMSLIGKVKRRVRKNPLVWRYWSNLQATMAYRSRRVPLSRVLQGVLDQLNDRGVAVTSVEALFGSPLPLEELTSAVRALETEKAACLQTARESAIREVVGEKTFMVELLGSEPLFDPESIFARFALEGPLLKLVNAYFGMLTRLRYYNVWHTFATQSRARESQLWHRDREDHLVLKAFVYCRPVDERGGPFTYAPGTHPKGNIRSQPEGFLEPDGTRRTTDEQMARLVPADQWIHCVGPKGTIVLADVRGYHKGGACLSSDRIMYTCMFTSGASQTRNLLRFPSHFTGPSSRDASYAVGV